MMGRRSYTSKPTEPVSFDLDGVQFVATGGVKLLELCELAQVADVDSASVEGAAALGQFFRSLLGQDYDRFRVHCREHGTDPDTLLQIVADVIEAVSERPTRRPSDSADGPPTTGRTWRVHSADGSWREEVLTPEREAELRAAVDRAAG
jgi:hypothetical protein